LAVAEALAQSGAEVVLLVSNKAVDRVAATAARPGLQIEVLPAVGWSPRRPLRFCLGAIRAWRQAQGLFKCRRPDAILTMGGFTSVGPVIEARRLGVRAFLHESNAVPGRANRWLARWVDTAFVGFGEAAPRLRARVVREVGTPVRADVFRRSPTECRRALGLDPSRSVLLICGGSQGARGINRAVVESLPLFRDRFPQLQFLHLAGQEDERSVAEAYRRSGLRAEVHGFLHRMGEALGAGDMAISRAGASSLAEFAAVGLPSLLVPYPNAADNHQLMNARIFAADGAARWCAQADLTPEVLVQQVGGLMGDANCAARMREALRRRHRPDAAAAIARGILEAAALGDVKSSQRLRARDFTGEPVSTEARRTGSLPLVLGWGPWRGGCG
jgi:UDP-N-acetylglucosamine--N-acetylmuramyl-(pentapeptide) pyrophosphoryl-undecaprenol N-acetylglucosamine transferase